jgi:hypothetical protein
MYFGVVIKKLHRFRSTNKNKCTINQYFCMIFKLMQVEFGVKFSVENINEIFDTQINLHDFNLN